MLGRSFLSSPTSATKLPSTYPKLVLLFHLEPVCYTFVSTDVCGPHPSMTEDVEQEQVGVFTVINSSVVRSQTSRSCLTSSAVGSCGSMMLEKVSCRCQLITKLVETPAEHHLPNGAQSLFFNAHNCARHRRF